MIPRTNDGSDELMVFTGTSGSPWKLLFQLVDHNNLRFGPVFSASFPKSIDVDKQLVEDFF